jgi:methionyl-tRNA formyltransferase
MQKRALRIVFAGTPEFAAAHLQALLNSHHQVIAVYTQPDRPAGRGKKMTASPVKQLAQQHQVPIYQPINLKEASAQSELAALLPDIMVVVAYGLLLPQNILDIPRLGCINAHASLLPRWRGAAPIQRAIEAGDQETGICIMQMEAGLDTGPVIHKQVCPILPADTGGSLHDRLATISPQSLLEALDLLAAGNVTPEVQDEHRVTYARKLSKQEAKLDFARSAISLDQQIRAFNPFPVCWCEFPDGDRLRVWAANLDNAAHTESPGKVMACSPEGIKVACAVGALVLTELQLPNRNRMSVRDIFNGHVLSIKPGDKLT